ncbi:hypothetical protein [Parachlamydia acanthamoebae]|uniref:hypothetical protein n=1 Tax=Parachlamydia acanthamoebae TaxID=83552 RepID=UPI000750905C|nr:hypothetical protein [Parachlamydia acanthamoebae]
MTNNYPLIHVGFCKKPTPPQYLFLRKVEEHRYIWFEEKADGEEATTEVEAQNVPEALRLAKAAWKDDYFEFMHCGFRYTLPERDEHGLNALFNQMVASYSSSNGVYFEQELGHPCIVQNASIQARLLRKKLKQANRL